MSVLQKSCISPKSLPAPRVERREFLARGEEATVSRVWLPGRREPLVERRQRLASHPSTYKELLVFEDRMGILVSPLQDRYYWFSFYALQIALLLAPDSFMRVRSLHFSDEPEGRFALMYSDLVEDSNGAIERKAKSIEEFRKLFASTFGAEFDKAYDALRARGDALERDTTCSLGAAISNIPRCIAVPHPEANYHLAPDGRIVFFEVAKIDINELLRFSRKLSRTKRSKLLSKQLLFKACQLYLATTLDVWLNWNSSHKTDEYRALLLRLVSELNLSFGMFAKWFYLRASKIDLHKFGDWREELDALFSFIYSRRK
ncbi:hypothetical protein HY992_06485 [Candidatus Micrarchaeota archaeon]|nr:hypothetical protein [Candidatus Micrarchaeota archaeon]